MKKLIAIAAIIATITLSMYAGINALQEAYRAGIEHALTNAEFWILDNEPSGHWDYDLEIFLDGDWWTQPLYVG